MGVSFFEDVPVDDVSEQVIVPQPVLRVHLLVVHGEGAVQDTPLLQTKWVSNGCFKGIQISIYFNIDPNW